MSEVLMTLGDVRFSVKEGAYQRLSRTLEIRVGRHDRARGKAARQALGEDERVEVEGVIYPGHAGAGKLERLRKLARTYEPQLLTDGRGAVWGRWLIERLEETGSVFERDGTAMRQEFRLSLGEYGDNAGEQRAAA